MIQNALELNCNKALITVQNYKHNRRLKKCLNFLKLKNAFLFGPFIQKVLNDNLFKITCITQLPLHSNYYTAFI